MAITRALMKRQMYNMGGPALEAGAPDLRLTGDQRNRGSYTQRRRAQMAGGGITNARQGYFLGGVTDFLKKVGQTIIPFGDPGYVEGGLYKTVGDILSMGSAQASDKIPDTATPPINPDDQDEEWTDVVKKSTESELSPLRKALATILPFGDPGYVEGGLYNALLSGRGLPELITSLPQTIGGAIGKVAGLGEDQYGKYTIPLGIGAAMGKLQQDYLDRQPKFPADPTSINFQTAAEAMADPNLRFKPQAQYANVAEGGRIGYAKGLGPVLDPPEDNLSTLEFMQDQGIPYGQQVSHDYYDAMRDSFNEYKRLQKRGVIPIEMEFEEFLELQREGGFMEMAQGGRIGLRNGGDPDDPNHEGEPLIIPNDADISPDDFYGRKEKPSGTMMADLDAIRDGYSEMFFGKPVKELTPDQLEEFEILFKMEYYGKKRNAPKGIMMAAQGGRIGYAGGADYYTNLYSKYAQEMIQAGNTPMAIEDFVKILKETERTGNAQGGRIGYASGGGYDHNKRYSILIDKYNKGIPLTPSEQDELEMLEMTYADPSKEMAQGGRIKAQEGGLMDLGGMEKDYRQEGGFVPIGGKEKADDVPARLSKNEFVFTADAVRSAGGGDIDEGAAVMERLMENLEAGGKVSKDSQGLEGAREMFATTQKLEKRII